MEKPKMNKGIDTMEFIAASLAKEATRESLETTVSLSLSLLALCAQTITAAIEEKDPAELKEILGAAQVGIPTALTGLCAGLCGGDTAKMKVAMEASAKKFGLEAHLAEAGRMAAATIKEKAEEKKAAAVPNARFAFKK